MAEIRHDWSLEEIRDIHDMPLLELVYRAATVHREHFDPREVQVNRLISIKTGACPEDCSYCAQSSRYTTAVEPEPLMEKEKVLAIARAAKANGITRICMGAAWREVKDSKQFDRVLDMVRDVTDMGLEVCATLGMLTESQAKKLEDAGLCAYNHNVDTSEEYYETIITTRTYADRLNTIGHLRKTNISVCSGGIIGLGESIDDRLSMLRTLASLTPHPESVPINTLAKVPGTPLERNQDVPFTEILRMIATVRIVMPASMVRIASGRSQLTGEQQALLILAGANSFFSSDERKMLTLASPSQDYDEDKQLINALGLTMRPPFKEKIKEPTAAVQG